MQEQSIRELLDAGRLAEAEAEASRLIQAERGSAVAFVALAAAARARGRHATAASALREATAFAPDDPALWLQLGDALAITGAWSEALRAYRISSTLSPKDPRPLLALASAQLAAQQIANALRTAERLETDFPAVAATHLVRAQAARAFGRRSEAISAYMRALAVDEANAPALLGLTELDAQSLEPELSMRVRRAQLAQPQDPESLAQLEFALARLSERAPDTDAAFRHFVAANALHREALTKRGHFCRREDMDWSRTARERFAVSDRQYLSQPRPSDFSPIFIVGVLRSGTTLVERILSRHPDVAAGGELPAANIAYADYLQARARASLPWPIDASDPTESRLLADAKDRYVELALAHAGNALRLTDKHPGNAPIVGFLRLLFPGAPVVHVHREPLAACWSMFTAYLPGSSACFTSLEDIAHYYAAQEAVMRYWASRSTPPMIDVSYERLVDDPPGQVAMLLAACGLPWNGNCLHPEGGAGVVTTASVDQVRAPIHHEAVAAWRRYDFYLQPLRDALDHARTIHAAD